MKRLRVSIPILKQMDLDDVMRQFVLCSLIYKNYSKNQAIFVPANTIIQEIPDEQFNRLIDAYAGVTDENVDELTAKLQELGVHNTHTPPTTEPPGTT